MHELSVTQSILEIALRHAENAGAERITDLYLVIGQLSSIVDDSVQFYWDIIADGTIAVGATLHFSRIPAQMRCTNCAHLFALDYESFACPVCKSLSVQLISGNEFYLEGIDIESHAQNAKL